MRALLPRDNSQEIQNLRLTLEPFPLELFPRRGLCFRTLASQGDEKKILVSNRHAARNGLAIHESSLALPAGQDGMWMGGQ
jgi:hypothetical protein